MQPLLSHLLFSHTLKLIQGHFRALLPSHSWISPWLRAPLVLTPPHKAALKPKYPTWMRKVFFVGRGGVGWGDINEGMKL